MNTMTAVKTLGAICGALLIFLLGNLVAGGIYTVGAGEGGHDEEHAQGYEIAVAEGGGDAGPAEPEVPFMDVFATADPAEGEKLWRQCASCHKLNGENATGPHLNGVVGRVKHSIGDFAYSEGMTAKEGDWTPEDISAFIHAPKEWAPGTKMAYRGMADQTDRANLISYLATQPG